MREEMANRIAEEIKAGIGEWCTVSPKEVKKNNGVVLQAVEIREPGMPVSPCIYIDGLLDRIASGEIGVSEAAQEVIGIRNGNKAGEQLRSAVSGLDKRAILEKAEYQIVNAGRNKELLAGIPHKNFLDLAAVYRVIVCENEIASFLISDALCKHYGIGEDEIDAAARLNTEREGFQTMEMDAIIAEITGRPEGGIETGCPMWVLTNAKKLNGAAVMLYPDAFKGLADRAGGDLYVLPSSIHEVIAVPTDGMDPGILKAMVGEVNSSEVSEEEFLSGNVYRYSRKDGKISIAKEAE